MNIEAKKLQIQLQQANITLDQILVLLYEAYQDDSCNDYTEVVYKVLVATGYIQQEAPSVQS